MKFMNNIYIYASVFLFIMHVYYLLLIKELIQHINLSILIAILFRNK